MHLFQTLVSNLQPFDYLHLNLGELDALDLRWKSKPTRRSGACLPHLHLPPQPTPPTIVSRLVIWFSVLSRSCSRYCFFLSSSLARLQRGPCSEPAAAPAGRPSLGRAHPCPGPHSLLLPVPQELPGDLPLPLQLLSDPLLVLLQLVPLLLQLLRESRPGSTARPHCPGPCAGHPAPGEASLEAALTAAPGSTPSETQFSVETKGTEGNIWRHWRLSPLGGGHAPGTSGWRPGALLSTLQCLGRPTQRGSQPRCPQR